MTFTECVPSGQAWHHSSHDNLRGSPGIAPVLQSLKQRAGSVWEATIPEQEASPYTWVLEMSLLRGCPQLFNSEENSAAWGQDLLAWNRPQPMLVLDTRGSHWNELVQEKWMQKKCNPDSVLIPKSMTSQRQVIDASKKSFKGHLKRQTHQVVML